MMRDAGSTLCTTSLEADEEPVLIFRGGGERLFERVCGSQPAGGRRRWSVRSDLRTRPSQLTLGTFVATFVFSVLALGSVSNKPSGAFVPHISVSVAIILLLVDL